MEEMAGIRRTGICSSGLERKRGGGGMITGLISGIFF